MRDPLIAVKLNSYLFQGCLAPNRTGVNASSLLASNNPAAPGAAYDTLSLVIEKFEALLKKRHGITIKCGEEVETLLRRTLPANPSETSLSQSSLFPPNPLAQKEEFVRRVLGSPNMQPVLHQFRNPCEFFDAEGVPEFKFLECRPSLVGERLEKFSEELGEGAAVSGHEIVGMTLHLSMSFWDERGNLFSETHEDYAPKGRQAASAMLSALAEVAPLAFNDYIFRDNRSIHLGPGRDSQLRHVQIPAVPDLARLEIRFAYLDPRSKLSLFEPEAVLAQVLGRVLRALDEGEAPALQATRAVLPGPSIHQNRIRYYLGGLCIRSDGSFTVPQFYTEKHGEKLAEYLRDTGDAGLATLDARGFTDALRLLRVRGEGRDVYLECIDHNNPASGFADAICRVVDIVGIRDSWSGSCPVRLRDVHDRSFGVIAAQAVGEGDEYAKALDTLYKIRRHRQDKAEPLTAGGPRGAVNPMTRVPRQLVNV